MVDWHFQPDLFYVGIICKLLCFSFSSIKICIHHHEGHTGCHCAIDHNYHLSRKPTQRKDGGGGGERGHRKYSKRSQKYHAEVVREEKSYNYFSFLICKMLQRRSQMEGSFSQPSDRNEFDPKQIAPTLGMKEPPPTEVLMKGPSRFLKMS